MREYWNRKGDLDTVLLRACLADWLFENIVDTFRAAILILRVATLVDVDDIAA